MTTSTEFNIIRPMEDHDMADDIIGFLPFLTLLLNTVILGNLIATHCNLLKAEKILSEMEGGLENE